MVSINVQVTFYSQLDEAAFFRWAEEIPCVKSFDPVTLFVKSKNLSKMDLWDLTALLYRYRAPMDQLRQFCNARNEHWYKDPKMFWYEQVFALPNPSFQRTASPPLNCNVEAVKKRPRLAIPVSLRVVQNVVFISPTHLAKHGPIQTPRPQQHAAASRVV